MEPMWEFSAAFATADTEDMGNDELPLLKWLSIMLPTEKDFITLENALRRSHFMAAGYECRVFDGRTYSTIGQGGREGWPSMPIAKRFASSASRKSETCMTERRAVTSKDSAGLKKNNPPAETANADHDDAGEEKMSCVGFVQILLRRTALVLLLVDRVVCLYPGVGPADGDESPAAAANLFLSAFAVLFPRPQLDQHGGASAPLLLLRAAIRVVCLLRNISAAVRVSWRSGHGGDSSALLMLLSPMCGEIVVQIMMQCSREVWSAVRVLILPLPAGTGIGFAAQVLLAVLRVLNTIEHVPLILSLVYRKLCKYLPQQFCVAGEEEMAPQISELHISAQLYYTALYRLAKEEYGPELCIGEGDEGFSSLLAWFRVSVSETVPSPALGTWVSGGREENRVLEWAWGEFVAASSEKAVETAARKLQLVEQLPSHHPLRRLESLWIENAPDMLTAYVALGGSGVSFETMDVLAGQFDAMRQGLLRLVEELRVARQQMHQTATRSPVARAVGAHLPQTPLPVLRCTETVSPTCALRLDASVQVPLETPTAVALQEEWRPRSGKETIEAAVQTVRTSARDEELLRANLRLQTRVCYLEQVCSVQQRDEQTDYLPFSDTPATTDVVVPFLYLKSYSSHLEHVAALEWESTELKKLVEA
ncbi:hypothetical protein DQ04_07281020 [Trypanosoma grayi]|uniref:hypothetical protein n=1 Tax=Trypanosoma grayi TaxID=71804 RepID=UPI0004F44A4F|nr:hypothetical protein DQ04_07281020 [Trypanosoma grayi]KEG08397.1 hypothetical protein DQ04_07281020 [Trypanosoma grayi]